MKVFPIIIGIVAALILSVLADWLLKPVLPKKPRLKHTIAGILGILVLVFIATWASFAGNPTSEKADTSQTDSQNNGPSISLSNPGVYQSISNIDSMDNVFPFRVGTTWTYNFGEVAESENQENTIKLTTGKYSETVAIIETGLSDIVKIIGVRVSGEKFSNPCAETDTFTGDLDIWYVYDTTRLFIVCSRDEARIIASDLVHDQEILPFDHLPEYVLPFEEGSLWPAFPDPEILQRDDTAYQWHVEAIVDVRVPAGEFLDCYRILLVTMGDSTIRWICPGFGLVAYEYHHSGSVVDYRAELRNFQEAP